MKKSILIFATAISIISCGPSKEELDAQYQQTTINRITPGGGSYTVYRQKVDSSEYLIVTNGNSCAIIKHR